MNAKVIWAATCWLASTVALADDKVVKIGNLDDRSSLCADIGGPGSKEWRPRTG